MANFCDGIVQEIERTECIGNSLTKINSNFSGLETAGCDLENELQSEIARLSTLINTLSANTQTNSTSVSITSASPMVAKAWVNFNGSFASSSYTLANGGIRAAYNVSSITDNGSPGYGNGGDYTVNLVPGVFSNGNYTVIGTVGNSATSPSPSQWCFAVTDFSTPRTATACRVGSYTFRQAGYVQQVDNDYMNVAFFGN